VIVPGRRASTNTVRSTAGLGVTVTITFSPW
jgi:hypothetical protein